MTCYWNRNGTCRHPKIGNTPASEERCGACDRFRKPVDPEALRERAEIPPHAVKRPNILEKAASWAQAEASLFTAGPVGDEEYRLRIEVCSSCDRLDKAAEDGKVGWCKACGCGRGARAELTVKARMPKAKCPIKAWPDGDTPSR